MRRISVVLLLALVLLLFLPSCGPGEAELSPVTVERAPIPQGEFNDQETDELVIMTPYNFFLQEAVAKFNQRYPQVEVRFVSDSDERGLGFLPKSLADGTGDYEYPDLIQLRDYTMRFYRLDGEREDTYTDFYGLLDDGVFLDLSDVLAQDPEFQLELYDQAAFEGGMYRGGRYVIPVGCGTRYGALLGSRELLEETGFDLESLKDANSFLREAARVRTEQGMDSALDSVPSLPEKEIVFKASSPRLLDRETGTVLPDPQGFQEFCETWKRFFYEEGGEKTVQRGDGKEVFEVRDHRALFVQESVSLIHTYSMMKVTDTPLWEPFPDVEGTVTGEILDGFGICARGKNHLNAWRFLKLLLSEEIQSDPNNDLGGIPVLTSGRESAFEYTLVRAAGWPKFILGEEGAELTEADNAHLTQVLSDIDRCEFYSPQVFRLFEEHMGPYFEGKERFSKCAQALSHALAEYLQGGK